MAHLFLDTNVMIDFLGERESFYEEIAKIIVLAERQEIKVTASSLSFVNTFYVLSKVFDQKALNELLIKFRIICNVSSIDEINIDKSLFSQFNDFEDAVQYHSAFHHNCDIFITRNKKDFKNSEIPLMTPTEYLISINRK
jgi:predicted nucleic acid-binding protein